MHAHQHLSDLLNPLGGTPSFVLRKHLGRLIDPVRDKPRRPKLGWIRYRNSRNVLGTVKNIIVSLSCGKWFASIQTEREVEQLIPKGGAVGIDMGIARFATTLSDGTFYAPLNSFKRHEPDVSVLRSCVERQPPDASPVRVCGMRIRGKRRSGRRDQCSQGGTRAVR